MEAVVTLMLGMPRLRPWTRRRTALLLFITGATARTSGPVALVVGTVLTLVNQGDALLEGGAPGLAWKVGANYAIPYVTSSVGALVAVRRRAGAGRPST